MVGYVCPHFNRHSPLTPSLQGEMLDNIQKQVERSVGYVKGGTEALVDAKKLQKNTRKVRVMKGGQQKGAASRV